MKVKLENGKYLYIFDEVIGSSTVFRKGVIWKDTTGDELLLAMAQRINELEEELDVAINIIEESGVDYLEVVEHYEQD